jgi:hypothetical protein
MNKAQNVTATFAPSRYALVVARSGNGSGTVVSSPTGINCGAPCIAYFDSGTSVTLTATAVQGSTFAGWSGASCSGIGACTVAVNQTKDVTANFTGSLGGGVVPVPSLQPAGLYDGIYQWDTGYYLSVHQKGDGALIGSIYWTYTANTEQVGARTIPEADTFDLLQGQIVGSGATMSGTRFYRACTLSYDLTFNANSTLTVRLNSVSNSPGVSAADVNCAARYNTVGSTWTIPRIY